MKKIFYSLLCIIGLSACSTENIALDSLKVTMFAKANTLRQVGFRSSEASRLRPHGKPPRCFS